MFFGCKDRTKKKHECQKYKGMVNKNLLYMTPFFSINERPTHDLNAGASDIFQQNI